MSLSLEEKIKAVDLVADTIPGVIIIHQLENMVVKYMSPNGLAFLQVKKEDIIDINGANYHDKYFNPEDAADYVPKITGLLQKGDESASVSYFQHVRPSVNHDWTCHLSTTKIFMKAPAGNPTHILTIACSIDPANHLTSKVNRLLDENNFLRNHHETFACLTKREKEILKAMALGENSEDIANKLHISETTVNTHRRNIRNKLRIENNYEIIQFAQAFDLI